MQTHCKMTPGLPSFTPYILLSNIGDLAPLLGGGTPGPQACTSPAHMAGDSGVGHSRDGNPTVSSVCHKTPVLVPGRGMAPPSYGYNTHDPSLPCCLLPSSHRAA